MLSIIIMLRLKKFFLRGQASLRLPAENPFYEGLSDAETFEDICIKSKHWTLIFRRRHIFYISRYRFIIVSHVVSMQKDVFTEYNYMQEMKLYTVNCGNQTYVSIANFHAIVIKKPHVRIHFTCLINISGESNLHNLISTEPYLQIPLHLHNRI